MSRLLSQKTHTVAPHDFRKKSSYGNNCLNYLATKSNAKIECYMTNCNLISYLATNDLPLPDSKHVVALPRSYDLTHPGLIHLKKSMTNHGFATCSPLHRDCWMLWATPQSYNNTKLTANLVNATGHPAILQHSNTIYQPSECYGPPHSFTTLISFHDHRPWSYYSSINPFILILSQTPTRMYPQ